MPSDSIYDLFSSINPTLPEGFNPNYIQLNYTTPYGNSELTFGDLTEFQNSVLQLGAIFGVRVGLAATAIPFTYFITRKRKPVFFLNMACLFTLFLHSILYICTLTSTYRSPAYNFSGYIYIDRDASVLGAVLNCLYVIFIGLVEASLTVQVFGIFKAIRSGGIILSYVATSFSAILGLLTTGLYLAYCSMSNKALFDENYIVPNWIVNAPIVCFAISSCLIMLMLLLKLAVDIRQRRKMGIKQFNFQHIVFIMSVQTMLIPTIIILLSFYGIGGKDHFFQSLSALGTALIGLSLPVTTMWATSANRNSIPISTDGSYVTKSFFNYSRYTDSPTTNDYGNDDDYYYEGDEDKGGEKTTATKVKSNHADFKFKKYENMERPENDSITPITAVTGSSHFNWDEVEYLSEGVAPQSLIKPQNQPKEGFITTTIQTSMINRK